MKKEPGERFQSAEEFRNVLQAILGDRIRFQPHRAKYRLPLSCAMAIAAAFASGSPSRRPADLSPSKPAIPALVTQPHAPESRVRVTVARQRTGLPPPRSPLQRHTAIAEVHAAVPAQANASIPEPLAQEADEFAELRRTIDQLSIRFATVSRSIDGLRQSLREAGLGLRPDIAQAEAEAKYTLDESLAYLRQRNAERARRSVASTQSSLERVERQFGVARTPDQ